MAPWESAIRHTICAMEMMTAKMDTMSWIVLLVRKHYAVSYKLLITTHSCSAISLAKIIM